MFDVVHRFAAVVESLTKPLCLLHCGNILRRLSHSSKFRINCIQLGTESLLIVAGKPIDALSNIGSALLRGGNVLLQRESARDFGYIRVSAEGIHVVSNAVELLLATLYIIRTCGPGSLILQARQSLLDFIGARIERCALLRSWCLFDGVAKRIGIGLSGLDIGFQRCLPRHGFCFGLLLLIRTFGVGSSPLR
jgi:hypothetical protein